MTDASEIVSYPITDTNSYIISAEHRVEALSVLQQERDAYAGRSIEPSMYLETAITGLIEATPVRPGTVLLSFGETDGDCEQMLFCDIAGFTVVLNDIEGVVVSVSNTEGIRIKEGQNVHLIPWSDVRSLHIY